MNVFLLILKAVLKSVMNISISDSVCMHCYYPTRDVLSLCWCTFRLNLTAHQNSLYFCQSELQTLTYRNAVQHCVTVFNQVSLNSSFKYVWKTKASQTLGVVKGKFPFTWKRTLNLCSEEERVCASVIKHYRNTYSLCVSQRCMPCTVVMLQVCDICHFFPPNF